MKMLMPLTLVFKLAHLFKHMFFLNLSHSVNMHPWYIKLYRKLEI